VYKKAFKLLKKAIREKQLAPCIVFNLRHCMIMNKNSKERKENEQFVYILFQMTIQSLQSVSKIDFTQIIGKEDADIENNQTNPEFSLVDQMSQKSGEMQFKNNLASDYNLRQNEADDEALREFEKKMQDDREDSSSIDENKANVSQKLKLKKQSKAQQCMGFLCQCRQKKKQDQDKDYKYLMANEDKVKVLSTSNLILQSSQSASLRSIRSFRNQIQRPNGLKIVRYLGMVDVIIYRRIFPYDN